MAMLNSQRVLVGGFNHLEMVISWDISWDISWEYTSGKRLQNYGKSTVFHG
jgi:hypothetical protein